VSAQRAIPYVHPRETRRMSVKVQVVGGVLGSLIYFIEEQHHGSKFPSREA
jgi:hypothetical protein